MIVMERDERILQRVYEHQFLLMDHVAEFFNTKNEAYRRVREMERAKPVTRK